MKLRMKLPDHLNELLTGKWQGDWRPPIIDLAKLLPSVLFLSGFPRLKVLVQAYEEDWKQL